MLKHIIFFKLKDYSPEECEKVRDLLLSMDGKVETIRDIKVGIDRVRSGRSYDIALEVVLDDAQALEDYQKDPYHCDVVKAYVRSAGITSVAVDYEF